MTTLVRPDAPTDGGGGEAPPRPHEPSRYAAWRSSWAVALRMARRDVRRHQGRSALIVVMVTVPTLLLSALVTIAPRPTSPAPSSSAARWERARPTWKACPRPRSPRPPTPTRARARGADPSRPIPGFDPAASPHANADAVSRVVGAPVVPMSDFLARTTIGDRRISVDGVALDGRRGLGDKLRLVSGRWPEGKGQALVTAYGMSRGLPDSGRLTVTVDGAEHTLDVVGVATVHGAWGGGGLVVARAPGRQPGVRWLDRHGQGPGHLAGRPVPERVRLPGHLRRGAPPPAVGCRALAGHPRWVQQPGPADEPHGGPGRGDAAHHHGAARRAGLRRQRRPPATHAGPRGEQRRQHGGAPPHRPRVGPGARHGVRAPGGGAGCGGGPSRGRVDGPRRSGHRRALRHPLGPARRHRGVRHREHPDRRARAGPAARSARHRGCHAGAERVPSAEHPALHRRAGARGRRFAGHLQGHRGRSGRVPRPVRGVPRHDRRGPPHPRCVVPRAGAAHPGRPARQPDADVAADGGA